MKRVVMAIGVIVFCFANVASAQPWRDGQGPPRERRMSPKDFGDVDRLERTESKNEMGQKRGEFRPQREFRPKPNWGMNNWGGDPWKSFNSGRQWGRVDGRGVGGPRSGFQHFGPGQLRKGSEKGKVSDHRNRGDGGQRRHHCDKHGGKISTEKQKHGGNHKVRPLDQKVMEGPGRS